MDLDHPSSAIGYAVIGNINRNEAVTADASIERQQPFKPMIFSACTSLEIDNVDDISGGYCLRAGEPPDQ